MNALAHPTQWRHRHYRRDGLLLWASGLGELTKEGIYRGTQADLEAIAAQGWSLNTATQEGQRWTLEAAFRDNPEAGNGGTFTNFELGLSTDNALAETDTYATRSELTDGNGYAGISVSRNTSAWAAATGTEPVGALTPSTGTHDFTASGGDWSTVYALILFTAGLTTNILIAYSNLSSARTVTDGDTLQTDMTVQANNL